jgi:short-subunit dehydrogenase involved in D-alanine esterification of teichoic acids
MKSFLTDLSKKTVDFVSDSLPAKIILGTVCSYGALSIFTNYIYPLTTRNKDGFTSNSTSEQVIATEGVDVKDKVIIITGSNAGIGKETARVLASAGAHVILSGRDLVKLKKVEKEIKLEFKTSKVNSIQLDLGDKESVSKFVETFKSMKLDLNILILNAGVLLDNVERTVDGFEAQIGINHLGHHRLTMQLLPLMKKTQGEKRIVVVSSSLHLQPDKLRFDDIEMTKEKVNLFLIHLKELPWNVTKIFTQQTCKCNVCNGIEQKIEKGQY